MKQQRLLLASAAVLLVVGIALVWFRPPMPELKEATLESRARPAQNAEQSLPPAIPSPAARPTPAQLSAPRLEAGPAENTAASAQQKVLIRADQVLATVNGVAITFKDLTPMNPNSTNAERRLELDMYDMLLNRAVERELAFQAAQAGGVQLTEAQRQNLAQMKARNEPPAAGEFDNLGRTATNTDFEQRDLAGLMLLNNVAAAAGVPSPHVTPEQVDEYYQLHRNEYPGLPEDPVRRREAWEAINADIRAKLAPALQTRHDDAFGKFIEALKAQARIAIARPI